MTAQLILGSLIPDFLTYNGLMFTHIGDNSQGPKCEDMRSLEAIWRPPSDSTTDFWVSNFRFFDLQWSDVHAHWRQ